jgi:hypothetical protein
MVQLMSSLGEKTAVVKLEAAEDSLEDQLSPLFKRSKLDHPSSQVPFLFSPFFTFSVTIQNYISCLFFPCLCLSFYCSI